MPTSVQNCRVLLVHGWLYTWAGAERVLDELVALLPQADILSGVVTAEMKDTHMAAARARESWVGRLPLARSHHRWFLPLHALAFAAFDAREYDLIVSISHGVEKMVRARKGATHVCYCLSPPRYLWDLRDMHADMASLPQRIALGAGGPLLRSIDRRGARAVDRFVSISRHVAERVRRSYGRESAVIYPPVQAKPKPPSMTAPKPPFLLCLGRLVPYKRLDLAIQAAERLQVKLVVAGEGPDRPRLERLGGVFTEFLGWVSEDEAADLLTQCAAFVFCAEEDFGIAPLEANAHGKPVVAYRKGAASETLIEGETALFFDHQEVAAVADAIERSLARDWDPEAARANARRFAPDRFRAGIAAELEQAINS